MLHRDIAKTTVTLYNHLHIRDENGNIVGNTYKRTVIPDCVWNQDSEASYRATGILSTESVKLLIPFDPEYFSVLDGQEYLGQGWTIGLGPELKGTYILKGNISYEFPSTASIISEDDLVRSYVLPFEKIHKYKKPKEVIEHFVGSRHFWYIEVRC